MKKKYDKPVVISPSAHIMTEFDNLDPARQIELCGRVCYKSEDGITPELAAGFCRAMAKHRHNFVLEMAVKSFVVRVSHHQPFISGLIETQPKYLQIDWLPSEVCDNQPQYLITGSIRAFREMLMTILENGVIAEIAVNLIETVGSWTMNGLADFLMDNENYFPLVSVRSLSLAEVDNLPSYLRLRHRYVAARFIVNRAVTHEIVRHRPCSFLQESQRYCRYSEGKFGKRVTFIKPMFFNEGSEEYRVWEESVLASERAYMKILKTSSLQAARTVLPNSCKTELIMFANLAEWEHFFHLHCSQAAEPSMREVTIPLREEFRKKFPQHSFDRRMPDGWV